MAATIERRRAFNTFDAARQRGPYDELPMLPEKFDIQLHLSRNDRPQPFYLICDHDTLLVQMSGHGQVEFKDSSVLYFELKPGDFTYVPAGMPHRFSTDQDCVQLRYKALKPEHEGVAWYCQDCGRPLWRAEWSLRDRLPQEGYLAACREFNADQSKRTCTCGSRHATVDLAGFQWEELVEALKNEAPAPEAD